MSVPKPPMQRLYTEVPKYNNNSVSEKNLKPAGRTPGHYQGVLGVTPVPRTPGHYQGVLGARPPLRRTNASGAPPFDPRAPVLGYNGVLRPALHRTDGGKRKSRRHHKSRHHKKRRHTSRRR